ncbi:helicase-exonuclease AddAB subunit AddA [Viridibacillus sp. FSL R5-0477]|uniref:ATP-dependent helicase/nuclease subunit A n=1 Tax=Viridibacillus arenosi FSL R5-213 TaxID=1227360 RepID=W4F632_9BACL|nr:helicase-exonuclease AddAB subunit AddA [Viridibacillus arenosi]ETT87832.1 ATP-dependent nuclease subunit A [Viridibacillus arenosi FSL R5-213]OMC89845.1 helicase-exonuclease AddAB subunit AddA [Viridibacillus arenosi]
MKEIPVKPATATWTDEQWKAIWTTGQDTLVSAAAGSGKTAVLINRMIEKVISSDNPIDVDELLVVTFTNASAAEMRHRMAEALEKAITNQPESKHLRRQLSLLNKAQISTLHSFCLNIVRQYAYLLDIDPGFRIANDTEAALLKDDTLAEVLEEAYNSDQVDDVYRLVDSFTSDRDDQAIETLIEKLYDMSRVNPEPMKWLESLPDQYDLEAITSIDELPISKIIKRSVSHAIEAAYALIKDMRELSLEPNGPSAYGETAEKDFILLTEARAFLHERSWEEAYEYFHAVSWARISTKKMDCDLELKALAQNKRKQAKELFDAAKKQYFTRRPERLLEEIRLMKPILLTLVKIAASFSEKYAAAKNEKGLVDFSDLEHFALQILTDEIDGELVPSAVALSYREKFNEVLVDEYQDTNRLQETILQLVKNGGEADGNMFMVGDVKQSIYRFRLAEPTLFLNKYLAFEEEPTNTGMKIDLNANFRSRQEVLHGTNYIFSQIMGEEVGEINYDEAAELKPQAPYNEKDAPIELTVLYTDQTEEEESKESDDGEAGVSSELQAEEELKKSQQEARYIIEKIKQLMDSGQMVYDTKKGTERPLEYRDIVILMRSMTWSGDLAEEFKLAGIPLYAELSKGYFEALEVMIMINTLRIIDNPYQDIPLASVLRAPFVKLTENELAKIRLADPKAPFYDALKQFVRIEGTGLKSSTAEKLQRFLLHYEDWRDLARRGSLADLIWRVYIDTNYYEMVGAMPNGKQRQANLRALHDRALSYEKTSFRGLFRFLRFVDRMRLRGDDLGTARAISETENVVRLMTIHSSKGLEFPYVFVAGLGREFNKMDFNLPYLFDQQFGLAVKMIDPEKRIQYTSLPFLAMQEKKKLELKAEEMRVLYVAMTRAKEHLYLVGTVKNWDKTKAVWEDAKLLPVGEMLPDHIRALAKSYLDWIGPALARHPDYDRCLNDETQLVTNELSRWKVQVIGAEHFKAPLEVTEIKEEVVEDTQKTTIVDEGLLTTIKKRFDTAYAYDRAIAKRSKTSVSELKRLQNLEQSEQPELFWNAPKKQQQVAKRPSFLQQRSLTAAEIGTAMHTVMQHIPQQGLHSIEEVEVFVQRLVDRQLLTKEEGAAVHAPKIVGFFATPAGQRFMNAVELYRETPFTFSITDEDGDSQIVQGIVDCLFKELDGDWILLDYKTDRIKETMKTTEGLQKEMKERYDVQLTLYKKALEETLKIKVAEKLIYAFDAQRSIEL